MVKNSIFHTNQTNKQKLCKSKDGARQPAIKTVFKLGIIEKLLFWKVIG